MTYRWKYKCRNCGATNFASIATGSFKTAENELIHLLFTGKAHFVTMFERHECSDGVWGVSDLVSMEETDK